MKKIIGKKIVRYGEVDSSSDEAKRLIAKGVGEGTVVISGSQSKGKGKPGSGWFSPPKVGIYLSAIVKPYKNPQDIVPLTLLTAQAVVTTIEKTAQLKAKIKHPNDVMINGKKICGVLVERVASGQLIIGLGINLNNPLDSLPPNIANSATSLLIETGKNYDLEQFVDTLLCELDHQYLAYLANI